MSDGSRPTDRDGPDGMARPPEHPRRGHERLDVHARPVLVAAASLVAMAVIIFVALYFLQGYLNASASKAEVAWNPLGARQNQEPLNTRLGDVPAPRLEGLREFPASPPDYRSSLPEKGSPTYHPEDLRPERQPRLRSYGWVHKEKGIAHIPVDQAMRVALEKNLLPVQPKANRPGESKAGRDAGGGPR